MEIDIHSVQSESLPLDSKCQKMKGSLGRSGSHQKRKTPSRFSGRFTLSKIFSDAFRSYVVKSKKDENKESKKKKTAPGAETKTNHFWADELPVHQKNVANKEHHSLSSVLNHKEQHQCAPYQMVVHDKKKMTRPPLVFECDSDPAEQLLSICSNSSSQGEIEQRSSKTTNNSFANSSQNGTHNSESAELLDCKIASRKLFGDPTEKDEISKKIQKSCKKMKAPNPFCTINQEDSKNYADHGMNENSTMSAGSSASSSRGKTFTVASANYPNDQFKSESASRMPAAIPNSSKNLNKMIKAHSFPSLKHANEKGKVNKIFRLARFMSLPAVLHCQVSSKDSNNACMVESEVDLPRSGVEIYKSVIHVKNEPLHDKINERSKLKVEAYVCPKQIVENVTNNVNNSSVGCNNDILEVRNREFYNSGKKSTKTIITVGSASNVGLSDESKLETNKESTSENGNSTSPELNADINSSQEFENIEGKEMKEQVANVQENTDFKKCQELSDKLPFHECSYMRRQRNNKDLFVLPPDETSKNSISLGINRNESVRNFAESDLSSANNRSFDGSSGTTLINVSVYDEERDEDQTQLNTLPAAQECKEMSLRDEASFDAKSCIREEKSEIVHPFENRDNQSGQRDEISSLDKDGKSEFSRFELFILTPAAEAVESAISCDDLKQLEKKVKIVKSESVESPDQKRLQLKKCNSDDRGQSHSSQDEQYKSQAFKMKQISEFICNQESKHFVRSRNNSFPKHASNLFKSYSCDNIYSDSKGIAPIFISPFDYYRNSQNETDVIRSNQQSIFDDNPSDSNVTSPDLTTYRKKKKYRTRPDDSLWLKHSDDLSTTDWEIRRGPDSTSGISSEESISEEERFFKRIMESSQVPSNNQAEENQCSVFRAMLINKSNNRLNAIDDQSATNKEVSKKSSRPPCKYAATRSTKNNKQAEDKPEWVSSSAARNKRRSMIDWGTLELKQNLDDGQVGNASGDFITTGGLSGSMGTVNDASFIFNKNSEAIDPNEEFFCKEKLKKIIALEKSTSTVTMKPSQSNKMCNKQNDAVKSEIIHKDSKKLSAEGQMRVSKLVSSSLCKAKSVTNLCNKSLCTSRIPVSTQCTSKFPNISSSLKSPNINLNSSQKEASIKNPSPNQANNDRSKFTKFAQSRSASMTNLKVSELNLKSADMLQPPRLPTKSLLGKSSNSTKNNSLEGQPSVSTKKEIPAIHSMQRRKIIGVNKKNHPEITAKKSSIPKSSTAVSTLSSNVKKPLKCPFDKQLGLRKVENGKSTQKSNLTVDNRSQLNGISLHNKSGMNLELSFQLKEKLGTIAV